MGVMGEEGFRWFVGKVVSIDDPKQLGRVKVKVVHEHDEITSVDDLEWAHVMLPTTSESIVGVGDTPSLAVGSNVIGFFLDSAEKQVPMIMGSYPVIPDHDDAQHSLSYLARGKQTLEKDLTGPEPPSAYQAEYPHNRVIQTRSGHVIELDDTPDHERIHIYHTSGSYIEINSEGQVVHKAVSDSYDIAANDKNIHAGHDLDISCINNITLAACKGIKIGAAGGVTIAKGSLFVEGSIGSAVGASGTFTTPTGQVVVVQNGLITSIS
jgi:hypothetical protein